MVIDENKVFKGFIITVLFGGLVAGLFFSIKLYYDAENRIKELETKVEAGKDLGREGSEPTVERLKTHIMLPDETPKVIPVKNVEYLKKEQPFFENASEGDVIVVYSTKVILYNPLSDKIVEVAQIRPDSVDQASQNYLEASSSGILE